MTKTVMLIKKDLLLCRSVLLFAFAVLVATFGLSYRQVSVDFISGTTQEKWSMILDSWANYLSYSASLLGAVVGGQVFAVERNSRSLEFLAYLPIRRITICISKLAVTWGFWLFNVWLSVGLGLVVEIIQTTSNSAPGVIPSGDARVTTYAMTFLVASTSWAASSYLESVGLSIVAGILSVSLLPLVVNQFVESRDGYPHQLMLQILSYVLGVLFVAIGVWSFCYRESS